MRVIDIEIYSGDYIRKQQLLTRGSTTGTRPLAKLATYSSAGPTIHMGGYLPVPSLSKANHKKALFEVRIVVVVLTKYGLTLPLGYVILPLNGFRPFALKAHVSPPTTRSLSQPAALLTPLTPASPSSSRLIILSLFYKKDD